jgi:hypothetical protein
MPDQFHRLAVEVLAGSDFVFQLQAVADKKNDVFDAGLTGGAGFSGSKIQRVALMEKRNCGSKNKDKDYKIFAN